MEKSMKKQKEKGITMIVLVITILVLLILARNKCSNIIWTKWSNNKGKWSKNDSRNGKCKRKARHTNIAEVMIQQEK